MTAKSVPEQLFERWWREQSAKGDPDRRPNLVSDAFMAGLELNGEPTDEARALESAAIEKDRAVNRWNHIHDFIVVLQAMRDGRWMWYQNSACKYVELRIDMRDGGCIIKDREGNRITPARLAYQYGVNSGQAG